MRRVVIPLSLTAAPPRAAVGAGVLLEGETMGTTWQVRLFAPASAVSTLRDSIEQELALVIRQMSHWEPGSDVSQFNRAPAGIRVPLPPALFGLLEQARVVAAQTGGAYDPAAGAMVSAWGFGPGNRYLATDFAPPLAAEIEASRERSGWQRLHLAEDGTAQQPGRLELDLSSIAKGFAVDCVARRLTQEGCVSHLVEIGGELRGSGLKADGQPWWVAIESPAPDAGLAETCVALCDHAMATSGDYRRVFTRNGQRHSHTIDPRTGRAVEHDLASVTVVARECWRADAVSTALMVLGADAGLAFANRNAIAARFVRRRAGAFEESHSDTWAAMLQ